MFNTDFSSNSVEHSPKLSNCPSFLLKTKLNKQPLEKIPKLEMEKENSIFSQKCLLKCLEIDHANRPQEFTPRSTPRNRSSIMEKFTDSWNFSENENVKSSNETLDSEKKLSFCSNTMFRSESAYEHINKKQINKNFVSSCDLAEKKEKYFKSAQFERMKTSPLSVKLLNSEEKLEKRESVNSNDSQHIMANDIKISDFQFLSQLGKGHCSVVYLARHKELNMIFAIKVLSKENIKSSSLEEHIFREIKIHSFIKDKNVVTLYKTLDDEKHIYLVMEYTPEGSLYSELKKNKKFTEEKTCKILKDISRGLKSIHANNIIHRDLKLENILLSNDVAKVADFGCAVNGIFMRKSLIGSPVYFSPEQLNHNFYGSKTDIWQLGVMAFEMLFGFAPFEKEIISAIQNDEQNVDLKLRLPEESLSEDARDFLVKCLDKRQNSRMDIDQVLAHPFLSWEL